MRRTKGGLKGLLPSKGHGHKRPRTAVITPPPVVVRREIPAPAAVEHRHTRSRRRFDVALPIPGAEMSLPRLPVLHVSWRILSGMMVVAFITVLYLFWTLPMFQVHAPKVNGLQRITLADVNTVIGLSNQPVFTVDPAAIRQNLQQAFPEMSAITVEVRLPATVVINLAERTPLIDWKDGDREVWVDQQGIAFPPRGDPGKLVVVEGQIDSGVVTDTARTAVPFISPQMVSAVLDMASLAPKKASIIYDPDHGLGWSDARGWEVYFGLDVSNMDTKLLIYKALVKQLKANGVQPAFISVEYANAPYYRMER